MILEVSSKWTQIVWTTTVDLKICKCGRHGLIVLKGVDDRGKEFLCKEEAMHFLDSFFEVKRLGEAEFILLSQQVNKMEKLPKGRGDVSAGLLTSCSFFREIRS